MATGLLGSAAVSDIGYSGVTSTVYTVPSSGVSYAVVHITLATEFQDSSYAYGTYVSVNDKPVLHLIASNFGGVGRFHSNALSIMLSAGNVVKLRSYRHTSYCTVSGYEVA